MTSISMLMLLAAVMIVVDGGNLWVGRRDIITGTDAAALRAASLYAFGPGGNYCDAGEEWEQVITDNVNDAAPIACLAVELGNNRGYISVDAENPQDPFFAGIFGFSTTDVYSLSAAQYFPPAAIKGLRPIGLCMENSHVKEWINYVQNGTPMPTPGTGDPAGHPYFGDVDGDGVDDLVHHIPWFKQFAQNEAACGAAPGNWGWQDYNGGSNPSGDTANWLRNGYEENLVGIHDCNAEAAPPPTETCNGDTGTSNSNGVKSALKFLKDQGIAFPIIVFQTVTGSGNTAEFDPVYFIGIRIVDFGTYGLGANPVIPDDKKSEKGPVEWLDVQFTTLQAQGVCCGDPNADTGVRSVRLCATDHDPQSLADVCSPTAS